MTKNNVANRSGQTERLDTEEVAPAERIPVRLHELLPGARLLPFGRWLDPGLGEDIGDRGPTDLDTEPGAQCVPDFRVAPAEVFGGEFDNQLADIIGLGWTASLGVGAVVLSGGELAEPSENGVWLHEVATLPTFFWREQLAGRGQTATLVRRE